MIWTAGTVNSSVRDSYITKLSDWLKSGITSIPFGDRFLDDTGATSPNQARPVVGGNFALVSTGQCAGELERLTKFTSSCCERLRQQCLYLL